MALMGGTRETTSAHAVGFRMAKRDLVFRIGGAAGDGVSSTAESFAKISARSGLHTWTYSSYQSVIRGGHVWTQIRGGLDPVLSHGVDPDVVVALNQQTMDVHQGQVTEGGAIVYDVDGTKPDPAKLRGKVRLLGIPLRKRAQSLSPNALMRNTVALGAAVRLFDLDFRHVESAFKDIWGDKKPEIVQQNIQAAKLGAEAVAEMGGSLNLGLAYPNEPKYLMTGNEAICLGALAAGVKFLAQYPMTPASSILHWMASHGPPHGVVVKQVEDELAAMNMAVGAGFAGVRAMTATSGGGFSLMVEAIGQAGMTETPLVAILVQRSGPSTGLPTKTEQGDLNLALGAGQGDWPRAIPGMKGYQFVGATDEHMENGELISDVLAGIPEYVAERNRMHEKRMRKLDGLRKDTPVPELWGPEDADLTLIHWGSTWGAAHEAIQNVEARGIRVNSLEFPTLFPFHTEATLGLLKNVKQSLAIEGNYTGQFTRLLRAETGYKQ